MFLEMIHDKGTSVITVVLNHFLQEKALKNTQKYIKELKILYVDSVVMVDILRKTLLSDT